MSKKKKKIPWPVNEYFIDEDTKTIYLLGSWSRAMMLHAQDAYDTKVPGYHISLCTNQYLKDLKVKHYDQTQKD